jgi:hypothetical protein
MLWHINHSTYKVFGESLAMTENKSFVSPPPDADGNYKYYLLGNTRPVRVTCDESGAKIFAEAPDSADGGALKITPVLSAILKDEDAEVITKAEFVQLCQRAALKKNPSPPAALER